MEIAVVCIGLLGLLLFALGLHVSMTRNRLGRVGTSSNDPADPLFKAIRAHGNTAEYAPMLAVLMLYLGAHSPAAWVAWVMIIVTVCRYLSAIGIVVCPTLDRPYPLRFVGAVGTYLGGIILSIAALATI
ncbi:MAG TPA: MAPEG family protein [Candidatus Binataceae bacterium]|jgi:uncharacterized membrane protein YecN with MAPEG domain|nr:MAPEG family protein [Candidatus Binataceae bacterium]